MLAVTGASGVGKSSLVNALRKVKDTDPDAAKTGVKETTMEPNMYRFRETAGLFDQRFYRSFEKGMELRPKEQILLQNVSETVDGRNAEVISIKQEKVKVRLDGGSVIEINLSQAAGLNQSGFCQWKRCCLLFTPWEPKSQLSIDTKMQSN